MQAVPRLREAVWSPPWGLSSGVRPSAAPTHTRRALVLNLPGLLPPGALCRDHLGPWTERPRCSSWPGIS